MQLARKFLLAVVAIALVVLSIGVLASIRSESELHTADIANDHKRLGETLAHVVDRIPHSRRTEEGARLLRTVLPEHEHLKASLIPLSGKQPADEALFQQAMSSGAPIIAAVSKKTGMFVTVVPLKEPGMAVELLEPIARQSQILRRIAVRFVLISLALTAGFVIATTLLGRRFIGAPMRMLVRQARSIGEGNLSETTPVNQDDEIGQLASELNAMASRLREADARAGAENKKRLLAVEQLRHADRLATVGTLASGIAHELGTPLAVVQGRAALIEEAEVSADVTRSARVIGEQVQRMTRIIRQVLDFARRQTPKASRVKLSELVDKSVTLLSSIAKKHSVEIQVSAAEPTFVMADPGLVDQALTNILMNAVQASSGRAGSVSVDITEVLTSKVDESGNEPRCYGCVRVKDGGRGIAPELLGHVFEPFYTTKDVGEGTGLGLSVAWGIIHDHDGWIDVESEAGKGSVFRVYLPCAEDRASEG